MRCWTVIGLAVALTGCVSAPPPGPMVPPGMTGPTAPAPAAGRRIAYNGAGGFLLPDRSTVPADPDGGFTLPNGERVVPDGTGGVRLPNRTRCVSDGARGYLCP